VTKLQRLTPLLALLGLLAAAPVRAEAPPEPGDYRQDDYRAPTPATLQGATVLSTPDAEALWRAKRATFVDVLPHAPKPANLPAGTIWREKPHDSIAGAVWLPGVGFGALAPATESYFKRSLASLTGGDPDKPLVIFCKKDCWMSWNAAKRAIGYGYHHLYWYPDGIDSWAAAALPMEPVEPHA
jgi:PQQ-dependent catabolism-associated CXXCW motif protein